MRFLVCLALLSFASWEALLLAQESGFDAGRLSFSVQVRGETNPYKVLALCAMPNEELTFDVIAVSDPEADTFTFQTNEGQVIRQGAQRFVWKAPQGNRHTTVEIVRESTGERMRFQILMMVPLSAARDGKLEGYRIGQYPEKALKGLDIYRPPRGLARLEPQDLDLQISPHFRLGQFICKQADGFPKFILLRMRLLLKLEYLLEKVNLSGIRCDSFAVLSGFRTPFYNKSIQNVEYSRHCWGGAADIFIDVAPKDGMMDDLNKDGKIDVEDARVLSKWIEEWKTREDYDGFVGGLGLYRKTSARGPFVHVDVRGFKARWGH